MLFNYFHSHHSPSSIVLMIWNSLRDKVQFQPTNLRFFLLIAIDYYGFNNALIHFLCKIVIVLRMYCKHSATYIAITCTIYSKRIAGLIAISGSDTDPDLMAWRWVGSVCSFRQDSHFVWTGILHGVGRSTKNFETCIVLYLSSTIWSSKQSKTYFNNNKIRENSKNEQKLLLF